MLVNSGYSENYFALVFQRDFESLVIVEVINFCFYKWHPVVALTLQQKQHDTF